MESGGIWHNGRYYPPMRGGDGTDAVVERVLAQIGRGALAQQGAPGALAPFGGQWGVQWRATSSTPSTPYYTGPNSLFGAVGLERDVISTRVQPFGLADRLPVQMTNVLWPQFAFFTGFAPATGAEPTGVCDDPPTAGAGASCIVTAQFGRFSRQSRVLEVNRMRQQMHRGEFQDLTLLNGPLVGGTNVGLPGSAGTEFNIRNEAYMRMLEVGIDFQLWLARKIYDGNPSNNTGGNGYREFPGLESLVSTGHVDANTNTTCPSVDSQVFNFSYGNISITPTAMSNFITYLTRLMRYMRIKAQGQNMGDVGWALVMRPGLFYELTAGWPCNYATARCWPNAPASGAVAVNVDGMDMARMRDDLREGSYLIVDGLRVPVIQDNMIQEDSNTTNSSVSNGSLASDVYLLPMTARGRAVLYWEFFDYRPGLGDLGALAPGAGAYYWTDGGRFLWHLKPPANWCVQILGKMEPRLILRTPHLAARISNVQYQTPLHEPDVDPTDPYFVRGGVTAGYTPATQYTNWGGGTIT